MNQPLKLGMYCPNFAETYSFLRVAGPLETMAHERPDLLQLIRPPLDPAGGGWSLSWDWILQCDALFFHHPFFDQQMHCIATARKLGRPVWIEFTDDMLNVPEHNPTFRVIREAYAQKNNLTEADLPGLRTADVRAFVRRQTTAAIDLASVVTVTSQLLKDALIEGCDLDSTERPSLVKQTPLPALSPSDGERVAGGRVKDWKISDKIVILPEAAFFGPEQRPRRKCVTWRGLGTHGLDVAEVLPQWYAVARDFPDWEWALFGQPSRELIQALSQAAPKRVKVSPLWPTVFDLHDAWAGCAPYLHVVPLQDTAFTRSKSHLAWLEATAIGAAVIVPDHLPEWQQPGVIPYYGGALVNGKENFEATLRRELSRQDAGSTFHPNVQTARQAIYPARTLRALNEIRWAILEQISGSARAARAAGDAPSPARAAKASTLRSSSATEDGRPGTAEAAMLPTPDTSHSTPDPFRSYSQAGQDRWVYELLVKSEGLMNGTFLDVGALCEGRPDAITLSNTYALEQLGWRGLLVDIAGENHDLQRQADFLPADAATLNWTELPESRFTFHVSHIDYLSLDVDEATLPTLRNLLRHGVRWRVATIEHDSYKHGEGHRDEIRRLMTEAGYTLACADVTVPDNGGGPPVPFEDWWVDLKTVGSARAPRAVSSAPLETPADAASAGTAGAAMLPQSP